MYCIKYISKILMCGLSSIPKQCGEVRNLQKQYTFRPVFKNPTSINAKYSLTCPDSFDSVYKSFNCYVRVNTYIN